MGQTINLESILAGSTTEMTKTAAVETAEVKTLPSSFEKTAAETTLAPVTTEENTDVISALEKTAAEIHAKETEVMTKEASLYGRVMADSFVTRLAEYQDTVADVNFDKTAGVAEDFIFSDAFGNHYTESDLEKFAALNDHTQVVEMEKVAQDAFVSLGEDDTELVATFVKEAAVHGSEIAPFEAFCKLAEASFNQGYNSTTTAIAEEQAPMIKEAAYFETMEKVASAAVNAGEVEVVEALEKHAYDKGFEEGLTKIAHDAATIGYIDTNEMIARIQA